MLLLILFYYEVTMGIDYEPLDLNEIKNEVNRINSPTAGNSTDEYLQKFVKMPDRDGYVMMRFLPRKKGQKLFCVTRVHTLTNPTTNQKKTYHCPRELQANDKGIEAWRGDCIICKYYSDLWQKSELLSGKDQEALQAKARELKPVERYYYNVIVRSETDPKTRSTLTNVGPKIFSCGKQVHGKIMMAIRGDKTIGEEGLGDITHPTQGRDFRLVKKVVKSGSREYPNYDNSKFENVSETGTSEELEKWLNNLNDLCGLRKLKTSDELKQALRVHTGMVVEGNQSPNELDEFYEQRPVQVAATAASEKVVSGSNVVKEEILSSKKIANDVIGEDESLVDDDFMKQLDGM